MLALGFMWTLVLFGIYMLCVWYFTRKQVSKGSKLILTVGEDWNVLIEGSSAIQVVAASGSIFELRLEGHKDVVFGTPADPPLGWNGNYYLANTQTMKPGKWWMMRGSAQLSLSSETEMTVSLGREIYKMTSDILVSLAAFILLWLTGMVIMFR